MLLITGTTAKASINPPATQLTCPAHPIMNNKFVDSDIIQYCEDGGKHVVCTVCPRKAGVLRTMAIRHVEKHIAQSRHQWFSERFVKKQQATTPIPQLENSQPKKAGAPIFTSTNTRPTVSPHDSNNPYMDVDMPDVDMEVPLSELLNHIAGDWTPKFDRVHLDLFAELQASLTCGEIPFSMPLAPINDERELFNDCTPDFGIEVPGVES
ncbi:uncharacterized protein EDB93DRAFT_1106976 [Suillus bovinus]|uniref:uncharacterized protein n=1 Tax=Suillus bovinus TaxID=48563 RepID=UPI001B879CB9|nr:uncharacterized protein EDB93DRAFT_1106976 [Suillus bovinus]KAG2136107.1 hypothetical protein EDB93DRAFT_1106976 [Suillus bovinus]